MLESLIRPRRAPSQGFTLIELMVVVALVAILLTVAVPSFQTLFASKRVEGVANELFTDIQFARSEAVSHRTAVRVTFVGDKCYVVHRDALVVTTCVKPNDLDVDARPLLLKSVEIDGSTASLTAYPGFVRFEPIRGVATHIGDIVVGSSVGNARLRISLSTIGRMLLCVPAGYSTTGYKVC